MSFSLSVRRHALPLAAGFIEMITSKATVSNAKLQISRAIGLSWRGFEVVRMLRKCVVQG